MILREELTRDSKRRYKRTITALIAFLVASLVISLCIGKYGLSIGETVKLLINGIIDPANAKETMEGRVIWGVRLPRAFAAMVIGAALSISGAAYQGVFRNPLISPDFLGASSGACIGAAVAILLGLSAAFIQGLAFIGGVIAVAVTVTIPKFFKSDSNIFLVLSGIIVSGVMSSIMAFIKYTADPTSELAAITYWQMGSFAYIKMADMMAILLPVAVSMMLIMAISWSIDVVSLGEKEAKVLGVNVKSVTYISVIGATLLTACSVCVAGTIGWVGLVVPHFSRLIVGPENTKLMPTTALVGAIFLLIVDTYCRSLPVAEMPLSILTGIIGAPLYTLLLYKQKSRVQ